MSGIGQPERATQDRVIRLFRDELHYRYLGDWQAILEEWYREQLKQAVPSQIAKWEPLIGVKVQRFYAQRMKTKWGSCLPSSGSIG